MQESPATSKGRKNRGVLERLQHMDRSKLLLLGYLSYIIIGTVLLALPFAQEQATALVDVLFIATSAVSTTGLITVDPGTTFTLFGEIVIIVLIQVGGLGYMTLSSFLMLAINHRLGRDRRETIRVAQSLPKNMSVATFLWSVVLFTLVCEATGAVILYFAFVDHGVDQPVWQAIFHAISAFCTAGFSLNANSLEDFRGSGVVSLTVGALSLLGAIGFIVVVDVYRALRGEERHLGVLSKIILRITLIFVLMGTVLLFILEPSFQELGLWERFLASFFQVMTASTTVGFNTHPISDLHMSMVLVLLILMVIGASPAGTGGGLKTTTFAALWGTVAATIKGHDTVRFFGRSVPLGKLQESSAAALFYVAVLFTALFVLTLTEPLADYLVILFEAISALSTIGLSLGITGDLSTVGKLVIIVLMIAGRCGILTFALALAFKYGRERENEAAGKLF